MSAGEFDDRFEDELRSLLATGQKIEAIKRYRERTGAGLKEAKDAVEALERGAALPAPRPLPAEGTFEKDVILLLEQGRKIDAIKLYRERTGRGLKDAKDAVEKLAFERGLAPARGGGCLGMILLVVIALAGGALAAADDGAARPNVLVVLADDLGRGSHLSLAAGFSNPIATRPKALRESAPPVEKDPPQVGTDQPGIDQ